MIYASPVPPDMASGAYYDQQAAAYYLSPDKLQGDYADVRFERELRWFRRFCTAGSVLDVGCSTGAFLYQLNRRFPGDYRVLGTDASGPALDYAETRGVPVVRGDFLKNQFPAGPFDAITFWAVLEHLAEPRAFLERAAALLKPGGRCVILVPNWESLAVRVLRARYRYIYPQHLNYFSRATLRRLVEGKFSVLASSSTHFNPIVIWQDWRHRGVEVSNAERGQLLRRTTAAKQHPLLRPVKLIYRAMELTLGSLNLADNLVFVLQKKV